MFKFRIAAAFLLILTILAWQVAEPVMGQRKRGEPRKGQYKRVHQDALALILNNQHAKAIKNLNAFLQEVPEDAESYYMLAFAYAQSNQIPAAIANVRRAIDLGLPAERFFAGVADGFEPLANDPYMVRLREQVEAGLVHGPMLGDITESGAKVWVRTATEQTVRVLVTPANEPTKEAITFKGRSGKRNDHALIIQLDNLEPGKEYRYQVAVNGDQDQPVAGGAFTTMLPAKQGAKFRIAFGGGSGYVPQHEKMWTVIKGQQPNLLFLLGDNVYSDAPKLPWMQKYCYDRRQSRTEFRELVAQTPVYSIWDDHDFGVNDCSGGPAIDQPPWKLPVYRVFRDNWANPRYGGGDKQPGCYYDFYLGDVHFIMLDGRYYRDLKPTDGSMPTMLGPVQRNWLMETIKQSTGNLLVLCSPVPWVYRAKGDSKDTWNGFKEERTLIFDQLTALDREGVLLMSADRHRSDLWKIERQNDYPLYEFNSSRLTNQHVHPEMKSAVFSYNRKQSFGTLDIDTTIEDPRIVYRIVSIDGEEVHRFELRRSQLKRKLSAQ